MSHMASRLRRLCSRQEPGAIPAQTYGVPMTTSARTAPVLVRSAEAETLQDGALSLITLLADAGATGGALTANKATLHKGSPGAPAHFHTAATEMFLVLEGSVRILLG